MSQMRHLRYFLFGLCVLSVQASAEIYKWQDQRGRVHYSDMPPSADIGAVEKMGVGKLRPLTSADVPKPAKESVPAAVPVADPVKQKAEEAAKLAEERVKAQNCANARSNYRNYAIGGRIQTVNEQGERVYLDDAQIQAGLAQAQQEIDANCAGQ